MTILLSCDSTHRPTSQVKMIMTISSSLNVVIEVATHDVMMALCYNIAKIEDITNIFAAK